MRRRAPSNRFTLSSFPNKGKHPRFSVKRFAHAFLLAYAKISPAKRVSRLLRQSLFLLLLSRERRRLEDGSEERELFKTDVEMPV